MKIVHDFSDINQTLDRLLHPDMLHLDQEVLAEDHRKKCLLVGNIVERSGRLEVGNDSRYGFFPDLIKYWSVTRFRDCFSNSTIIHLLMDFMI